MGEPGETPGSPSTDPEALIERLQELLARLESIEDPDARDAASEVIATLMEMYGEGLGRIFGALSAAGSRVAEVRDALVEDGVIGSLLLIHGLYPVELGTRVLEALEGVRPYLDSHGGDVELIEIEGGVARLRLKGSCDGCPASSSTLELAIKQALEEAAPDLLGLEVEGMVEAPAPRVGIGKPLPLVSDSNGGRSPNGGSVRPFWQPVEGVGELASGDMRSVSMSGTRVLIANVGGTLLAYRNGCAGCGTPLDGSELEGGVLTCSSCKRRFELPLAGRMIGPEPLQLAPIPLLAESGTIRIALGQ